MKHTQLLTTIILSCLSMKANAQLAIGLNAGYTNNEYYTNISNYDGAYYKRGGGFTLSIPLQWTLRDWLALGAEPGLIEKSFSLWQTAQTARPTQLTSRYSYWQLPLLAHFSFGSSKLRSFFNLGGYGSYWISGQTRGDEPDIYHEPYMDQVLFLTQQVDGKFEFDNRRDRRFQFGWLTGAGLQYKVTGSVQIFAEYRYMQDLTDQQKNYMFRQVPRYNMTTAITAGCLYSVSWPPKK